MALLRQPGTDQYLPVTSSDGRSGHYWLWDPSGSTVVAILQDYSRDYADGQVAILPLRFWHFLKLRDAASSRKLREISHDNCSALFRAASEDRPQAQAEPSPRRGTAREPAENPLTNLLPAVKKVLPSAPERLAVGVARIIERADARPQPSTPSATGPWPTRRSRPSAPQTSGTARPIWPPPIGDCKNTASTKRTDRSRSANTCARPPNSSTERPSPATSQGRTTSGSQCSKTCRYAAGRRTGAFRRRSWPGRTAATYPGWSS